MHLNTTCSETYTLTSSPTLLHVDDTMIDTVSCTHTTNVGTGHITMGGLLVE